MSQQDFIQAIFNSLDNESESNRINGEKKLLEYIENSQTISLCLEILMTITDEKILFNTAVYTHKVIKKHYKTLELEDRSVIRDMVMSVLTNKTFTEKVANNFLDSVKYIFSHSTEWNELIEYVYSIKDTNLCLLILKKIILKMTVEVFEQNKEFILQTSLDAMNKENINTKLLGVTIFHQYIAKLNEYSNEYNEHLQLLINILENCQDFNEEQMVIIWSCISDLSIFLSIPDEVYPHIIEIAMEIGQNVEKDPKIRSIPIDALIPKLESLSEDIIEKVFTLTIDITAAAIEQDQSLDDESLYYFNTAACVIEHSSLYTVIQAQIQQAFESESFTHQIVGLLIFKTLLEKFPNHVYNDLENVISFITTALSSEEDLLKEAALRVIESFVTSFSSSNAYTHKFVPLIVPNLLSPSIEVRDYAFKSLTNIIETLDTKISGFLDQLLQISEQISPDSIACYLTLIAIVVDSTDEFSDEDCDKLISLISSIIEMNDNSNTCVCFEIAVSLLHQDESQLEYVVETLFPYIELFLQTETGNSIIINETFDFIGNMSTILRENSYQYLESFIPKINEFLDDHDKKIVSEVKSGMVLNASKFAKFCGENAEILVKNIIPNIKEGLKSEDVDFQKYSAQAIRKIKKFLKPQEANELFTILIKDLSEAVDYDEYIDDYLLTISKLLIVSDESNLEYFVGKTAEFVHSVLDNSWDLLDGTPLVQKPCFTQVLPPLSHLFSAIFHYKVDINNDICQYLIQLMQSDSEIDLFEIVGTLSDCLEFKNVSDEMCEVILNSVIQVMENASEPSLLQNLVYLMNVLVQDERASNLLQNIIELTPTFEKWRQISENTKFGYQEVLANIASLYIQIAIRYNEFPDKLIIFSIQQFPPIDLNETSSMVEAIMKLVKTKQNSDIYLESAMAFVRFFLQEESKVDKAKVRDELKKEMVQYLKQICSQEEQILHKIKASYGKQKSKIRKIEALLNSE